MTKDVLHIITSNKFFNNMIIESFERIFPGRNEYVFCESKNFPEVKMVTGIKISFFSNEFNSLFQKEYKLVIIHHLNFYKASLLNVVKPKCIKVWICWGADAFDLPKFRNQFYTQKTIRSFSRIIFKSNIVQLFKSAHKILFFGKNKNREIYKAISGFDYIATLLPGDFNLITQRIKTRAKPLNFNYFNTESLIEDRIVDELTFKNILIGNSSTLTNNHIDIVDILCTKKVLPGEVIVPLVYGDSLYRKMLINYIGKHIKGNIRFLTNSLSHDDYYRMLRSCGFAIMNHLRQQALGNILPLLGFGTKVFLNKNGQLYHYLSENEFIVFSIEHDLVEENAFLPLTEEQRQINRSSLRKIRSAEKYVDNMRDFKGLI